MFWLASIWATICLIMLVLIYWRLRDNQIDLEKELKQLQRENKAIQEALQKQQ